MLQAESGTVLSEQPLAKFAELKDRCCQNKIPAPTFNGKAYASFAFTEETRAKNVAANTVKQGVQLNICPPL